MYKIAGIILIMVSVFILFYRNSITDYCTYIFLRQTAEILKLLQFENISLKTYPQIFSSMKKDKLYLYKNFDFCNRNDFFHNLYSKKIIEQSQLSAVSGMFSQLGYRNAKRENEYIARCIAELQYKTEFYRQNYTQNGKTNRMCGLSVGIVIMIMLF